jgi:hypothetical protein
MSLVAGCRLGVESQGDSQRGPTRVARMALRCLALPAGGGPSWLGKGDDVVRHASGGVVVRVTREKASEHPVVTEDAAAAEGGRGDVLVDARLGVLPAAR